MSATSVSSASLLSLRLLDPARTLTRTNADDLPFALSEKGVRTWGDFAVAVNNWRETFSNAGIDSVALYFTDLFDLSSPFSAPGRRACGPFSPRTPRRRPVRGSRS